MTDGAIVAALEWTMLKEQTQRKQRMKKNAEFNVISNCLLVMACLVLVACSNSNRANATYNAGPVQKVYMPEPEKKPAPVPQIDSSAAAEIISATIVASDIEYDNSAWVKIDVGGSIVKISASESYVKSHAIGSSINVKKQNGNYYIE